MVEPYLDAAFAGDKGEAEWIGSILRAYGITGADALARVQSIRPVSEAQWTALVEGL